MSWAFGRQSPDTSLMRFVSLRFPYPGIFLDIGCGEGANARELWRRGNRVFTIDKAPEVKPAIREALGWHFCGDICDVDLGVLKGPFDLIYDINTLCHVERPPWEKIRNALVGKDLLKEREGVFFSICPTHESPKYIADGKDFTRRVDEYDLRKMLTPFFSNIRIYWRAEPDFKSPGLESWVVEARP